MNNYGEFIKQIEEIKRFKTFTVKDSGINPNSSRGFSLLVVELLINNKKYFKTLIGSPGLETIINTKNEWNKRSRY